ncbi:nuclease-related domain-containing protein [Cardiobacterium sp. Marseille-Q4385]|uniref:nuclease-related domain-containing protein n=1 Tax=Cardiobacterium sp. Marseille-Q4385 TaxID=2866573 RepID=UPI001CE46BF4|nr:NERD domain-containing protein [Cardiobacterium sp. Marseille-Q4385]
MNTLTIIAIALILAISAAFGLLAGTGKTKPARRRRNKGDIGESRISILNESGLDENYIGLDNILIPLPDGGTTQIDHIVVSPYGLYIIETKNMDGWIYGNEYDSQWTQVLYKQKNTFQNPLRQNYKHCQVIASALNIDNSLVHSVIVFIGDSEFKTPLPANVCNGGAAYLNYIKEPREARIPLPELPRLIAAIQKLRLENTAENRIRHIAYIEQIRSEPRCPRCGGKMEKRIAQNGPHAGKAFYGCSKYPRCHGTRPIEA